MMINGFAEDYVVVALQIDHSRVAGYLAAHWGNDDFARLEPYEAMVLAAQEHDNGWWSWEVAPTIAADGSAQDYIGSVRHLGGTTWLDMAREGVGRLAEIDPYAALLAQMHAEGLLTQGKGLLPRMRDQSDYPGVTEFLAEGEAIRTRLVAEVARDPRRARYVEPDAIWTNFKCLEVFDQLSQYLCNRYPFDNDARGEGLTSDLSGVPVPVRPGEADTSMLVTVLDESRAVVDPYPFGVAPLKVSFPARLLPNRSFSDRDDFLGAFYRAERIGVDYTLLPADAA